MAKLTFGKYKGKDESEIKDWEYLRWASRNVKYYKPSEETLQRIKAGEEKKLASYVNRIDNYEREKRGEGGITSKGWGNCSDLEICIYGS